MIKLKILKHTNIRAIALFPFIFIRDKIDKKNLILNNHERIHLRQQLEMLIIPFYIWYGIESIFKKYEDISFEREAFNNENNLEYLKDRKWYSWVKYLKSK